MNENELKTKLKEIVSKYHSMQYATVIRGDLQKALIEATPDIPYDEKKKMITYRVKYFLEPESLKPHICPNGNHMRWDDGKQIYCKQRCECQRKTLSELFAGHKFGTMPKK